eukprot:3330739-Rhodomonas_salina.1
MWSGGGENITNRCGFTTVLFFVATDTDDAAGSVLPTTKKTSMSTKHSRPILLRSAKTHCDRTFFTFSSFGPRSHESGQTCPFWNRIQPTPVAPAGQRLDVQDCCDLNHLHDCRCSSQQSELADMTGMS